MLVDAPYVTATQADAMPVEKFQDLDRDLATHVEVIAELRRTELTIGGFLTDLYHDLDDFRDGAAQEKVVMRDLDDLSDPAQQLQQSSHIAFAGAEHASDIAHPRRSKSLLPAEQRCHFCPEPSVRISQPDRMLRHSHPGAVEGYLPRFCNILQ